MKHVWLMGAALAFSGGTANAADLIDTYRGNECGGPGGFSNCYAFPNGTTGQGVGDGTGSAAIFKVNSDGSTDVSSLFPSIDGSEFNITFDAPNNVLNFAYNAGMNDPQINYFAIFQAGRTSLFFDATAIASGSIALSDYYPRNPGYSHITFFGSAAAGTPGAVPEPATWALFILGFGLIGSAMRRRNAATSQMRVSYN